MFCDIIIKVDVTTNLLYFLNHIKGYFYFEEYFCCIYWHFFVLFFSPFWPSRVLPTGTLFYIKVHNSMAMALPGVSRAPQQDNVSCDSGKKTAQWGTTIAHLVAATSVSFPLQCLLTVYCLMRTQQSQESDRLI